jgi:hypothetical protein
MTVRNVALAHLKAGTPPDALDAVFAAMRALRIAGMLQLTIGRDLGLREGNASFAIVCDFVDEAAYQRFDTDEEHNRIRRELVAPLVTSVDRCQFAVAAVPPR